MTEEDENLSIVEYYAENNGYRCGYCKSPNTNHSQGMWAHSLTVQDYQDMIDRGWRRSGCYCYKPTMNRTCCPMYTIKCAVTDFKISKSQKKKLKRFHNFLLHGKKTSSTTDEIASESTSDHDSGDDNCSGFCINDIPDLKEKAERAHLNTERAIVKSIDSTYSGSSTSNDENTEREKRPGKSLVCETEVESKESSSSDTMKDVSSVSSFQKQVEENPLKSPLKKPRPGDGMDPSRPLCKKAKLLRQERREKKLAQLSSGNCSATKKTAPAAKSLEDFIYESLPNSLAHRLEIKLVRSCPASQEFTSTFKTAFHVYQRYQTTIHDDSLEKLTEKQFTRFLVTSPLKPWKPKNGPPQGYGSFHQQYWLDDRLIAVGVIDILPSCISSVYFFYDPEFQFLVLGTYGSLREIAFCRSLQNRCPELRYYYMGFYIHSCPKMRYKGSYSPSYLLCPEAYSWHPIERCIPLLERSKYSRLDPDPEACDPDRVTDIADVAVLFHNKVMRYQAYCSLKQLTSQDGEVTDYANLVGSRLAKRMFLVLM